MDNKITKADIEQRLNDLFDEYNQSLDKMQKVYEVMFLYGHRMDEGVQNSEVSKEKLAASCLRSKIESVLTLFDQIPTGLNIIKLNTEDGLNSVQMHMTGQDVHKWMSQIKEVSDQLNLNKITPLDMENIHLKVVKKFDDLTNRVKMFDNLREHIGEIINQKVQIIEDQINRADAD